MRHNVSGGQGADENGYPVMIQHRGPPEALDRDQAQIKNIFHSYQGLVITGDARGVASTEYAAANSRRASQSNLARLLEQEQATMIIRQQIKMQEFQMALPKKKIISQQNQEEDGQHEEPRPVFSGGHSSRKKKKRNVKASASSMFLKNQEIIRHFPNGTGVQNSLATQSSQLQQASTNEPQERSVDPRLRAESYASSLAAEDSKLRTVSKDQRTSTHESVDNMVPVMEAGLPAQ